MRFISMWGRRLAQDERGGAALEFALVGPVLVALCIFAVEAAGLVIDYRRIVIAAEAGAEVSEGLSDYAEAEIEAAAASAFGARGADRMEVAVSCVKGSGSQRNGLLTVEVHYTASAFAAETFTMAAKSVRAVHECAQYDAS
ncbi:MAG: TadE/TadG family type IV pilus assembly protein [Hyphomicrobiales bacterium]|nr:TadE/TadG family type IV pilus assembly protein [Hyphomicrobiales bacterium]